MRKSLSKPAKALLTAGVAFSLSSLAYANQDGDETDLSGNPSFCTLVETFGAAENERIIAEIDALYDGYSERINRRKTLVMGKVQSVTFNGCKMRIVLKGTLKRKIRRDARGLFYINATMKNMRLDLSARTGRGFVKNAEVDKIRVSRTLRLAEAFYRKVANRFVEKDVCFDMRF